ncbi:hypothetical protein K1719_004272 [Acacia pycnantha]|nr:hypothetical protein K1719_004272 [Acacia pycnantha]
MDRSSGRTSYPIRYKLDLSTWFSVSWSLVGSVAIVHSSCVRILYFSTIDLLLHRLVNAVTCPSGYSLHEPLKWNMVENTLTC